MISSLPKFDKDILDACQPVTLNGMRLLFPGRAVKLCRCREITDDDLKDLTDFVAADLGVTPDGAKLSYIALCNPVVTMGAGADKYYLTGYDDPVFGAKDHPIKFYGSEIRLYGKKYLCEVNSNAFFAEAERVCGLNIAKKFAELIISE